MCPPVPRAHDRGGIFLARLPSPGTVPSLSARESVPEPEHGRCRGRRGESGGLRPVFDLVAHLGWDVSYGNTIIQVTCISYYYISAGFFISRGGETSNDDISALARGVGPPLES
jgi:hypothetical protein